MLTRLLLEICDCAIKEKGYSLPIRATPPLFFFQSTYARTNAIGPSPSFGGGAARDAVTVDTYSLVLSQEGGAKVRVMDSASWSAPSTVIASESILAGMAQLVSPWRWLAC
jgi:hypothetical protein